MKFLIKSTLVAFAAACVASSALAAPRCLTQAEADAMNVRILQTDLMVSGLSCQLHGDYATFVKGQKTHLADHGKVMRDYFQRAGGQKEMDRYVTSLANESSTKSLKVSKTTFCDEARALYKEVNVMSHQQLLEKIAKDSNITARVGTPLCAQTAKK